MELKQFLDSNKEKGFNEQFEFEGTVNAGSLKFQSLTGINPQFSEIKTVHKKPKEKKEEDKEKDKDKDKKDEKKNEETKKEEPKKEEPKKEEPKN